MKKSCADKIISEYNIKIQACSIQLSSVSSDSIDTFGAMILPFYINGRKYLHKVVVSSAEGYSGDILVGTDLLNRLGNVTFNFQNNYVEIQGKNYHFIDVCNTKLSIAKINEDIDAEKHFLLHSDIKPHSCVYDDELEYIPVGQPCNNPDLSELSSEQTVEINKLLSEYHEIIPSSETDIGRCDIIKHSINTGNHKAIVTRQWPIPHSTKQVMEEEISKMLKMGVIEPCSSPWHSPSLLVKKKNGSFRYCIDYRAINAITVKDNFPMPRIETVLESLKGATYFSSIDLRSGYWQVSIAEEDRDKTAFSTQSGTYRFLSMPFGLCNAPATFQRVMQTILSSVLGICAFVYLDDIVVFSKSFEQHTTDLTKVFALIKQSGMKISPEKCAFAKQSIKYLGHIVSSKGIEVDPEKIVAIQKMRNPKTVKEVRSIVGVASYYRKFVPNFSEKCAPLTELTKRNTKFCWNDQHENAFQVIKTALTQTPILKYPDYTKKFKIQTDSSDIAMGAALTQEYDSIDHPITYFSRKFNPAETRYSVTEKEALCIIAAVKHFHQYIYGYKFTIVTDHAPLRYLFQYKATVPRIARWALLLAQFDYDIIYKPGKQHILPDTLSRTVAAVNPRVPKTLHTNCADPAEIFNSEVTRREQENDSSLKMIIETLENADISLVNPDIIDQYSLQNDCLYYQEKPSLDSQSRLRLVVPRTLINKALVIAHDIAIAGHFGVKKTLHRAKDLFFWPNQSCDVKSYVSNCQICQKRNYQGATTAKIGQLPTVKYPLERVGVDLIGKLSPSHSGNYYILTIVDHFSRFVQAYPLENKRSETVTKAFLDYICRYGCPENIVSDRGCEFTSHIFREVIRAIKSKLHVTSAFHPQANGMTEAFNKLIKNTIHSLVQSDVMTWDEELPCAVLALNCSFHPSIKNVPYFLFHGRDPPICYSTLLNTKSLNYAIDDDSPLAVYARLQKTFQEAQNASQDAHDLNVRYQKYKTVKLAEGEAVFLKNETRRRGPYSKFYPYWQGPYRVTKVLNEVNYEITPIHGNKKTQVVHINRLKRARQSNDTPFVNIPIDNKSNATTDYDNRDRCDISCNESNTTDDDDDDNAVVICTRQPKQNNNIRYALRSRGPPPYNALSRRTRPNRTRVIAFVMLTFFSFLLIVVAY